MKTLQSNPNRDGFHMPAEFEYHSKCWMLWPERPDTWRLGAEPARRAFADVATAISRFEPVSVGVSGNLLENASSILPDTVNIVEIESDDAWMRDVGPTFLTDLKGNVRGVDWQFNAWGGKEKGLYYPWDRDNLVASKVLELAGADRYQAPLILEGGSIHVDGEGTLITTEECLLNRNRNPHLTRNEIESLLTRFLGVTTVIWLGKGCFNDETDGHVDNLCCFSRPGEVVLNWTDDTSDPQYEISLDGYERLSKATDARGRSFIIHKIHQPGPLFMTEKESKGLVASPNAISRPGNERLAGSYVNFYIANGGIIAPQFGDPHDQPALESLRRIFKDRKVVGVQSREILLGGGNIHCITQQQPG